MSGVNRLKVQKVTERGARGNQLAEELDRELNKSDSSGEECERAGIEPKRSYGKGKRKK